MADEDDNAATLFFFLASTLYIKVRGCLLFGIHFSAPKNPRRRSFGFNKRFAVCALPSGDGRTKRNELARGEINMYKVSRKASLLLAY